MRGIRHFDGMSHRFMFGAPAVAIRALWGSTPVNVYAVGDSLWQGRFE